MDKPRRLPSTRRAVTDDRLMTRDFPKLVGARRRMRAILVATASRVAIFTQEGLTSMQPQEQRVEFGIVAAVRGGLADLGAGILTPGR